jgi:hypothetical protein
MQNIYKFMFRAECTNYGAYFGTISIQTSFIWNTISIAITTKLSVIQREHKRDRTPTGHVHRLKEK